jgi:hypothetical protein
MAIDGNNIILFLVISIVLCSFLLYWIIKNSISNSTIIIEFKKVQEELAKG